MRKTLKSISFALFLMMPLYSIGQQCILIPYEKNTKFGFKNCSGEIITEAKFAYCHLDQNPSFFRVQYNLKYGVVNTTGNFVIPPIWSQIQCVYFLDSAFITIDSMGSKGLITTKNITLLPPIYNSIKYIGKGIFILNKDQTYSIFNLNTNKIKSLSINLDNNLPYYNSKFDCYNRFLTKDNQNLNVCIDTSGQIIQSKFNIHSLNINGDIIVTDKNRFGVCNPNFNIQIPIIYNEIRVLNDSSYIVKMKNNFNILNKKNLSVLRTWEKSKISRINDSMYMIKNVESIDIYSVPKSLRYKINGNFERTTNFEYQSNQYFISNTKDSSYLFKENILVMKVNGSLFQFQDNALLTSDGKIYNLKGDLIFDTHSYEYEVLPTPDKNIIEINTIDFIRYYNLNTKELISEIIK